MIGQRTPTGLLKRLAYLLTSTPFSRDWEVPLVFLGHGNGRIQPTLTLSHFGVKASGINEVLKGACVQFVRVIRAAPKINLPVLSL